MPKVKCQAEIAHLFPVASQCLLMAEWYELVMMMITMMMMWQKCLATCLRYHFCLRLHGQRAVATLELPAGSRRQNGPSCRFQ